MVFLEKKLTSHDAILIEVLEVEGQNIVGDVEHIYSRRFEGPKKCGTGPISFVGTPGHWGNATLVKGERAIVFIGDLGSDRGYYQDPSNGHFSIITINDVPHAIAHWNLLAADQWEPRYIFNSAFHYNPAQPNKTAIPLDLLVQHMQEQLNLLSQQGSRF